MATIKRGQAYRLDWQGDATDFPELNRRSRKLWIATDEMIQSLFKRLKDAENELTTLEEEVSSLNILISSGTSSSPKFIIQGDFDSDGDGSNGQMGPPGATGPAGPIVPYFIAAGDTFTVPIFDQALFAMNIDNEGNIVVNGFLIEVD